MLFRIRFKGTVPPGKDNSVPPVSSAVTTNKSATFLNQKKNTRIATISSSNTAELSGFSEETPRNHWAMPQLICRWSFRLLTRKTMPGTCSNAQTCTQYRVALPRALCYQDRRAVKLLLSPCDRDKFTVHLSIRRSSKILQGSCSLGS